MVLVGLIALHADGGLLYVARAGDDGLMLSSDRSTASLGPHLVGPAVFQNAESVRDRAALGLNLGERLRDGRRDYLADEIGVLLAFRDHAPQRLDLAVGPIGRRSRRILLCHARALPEGAPG